MCQRERHVPWSKQSLCVITPQYSAPGRSYDFRGTIACKDWQTHATLNLIAYWQSNYYQTAHQMVRYISICNPHFGRLDPPIIPAAAGPPRHPPNAGGGHKVAPLYFCKDIVATRRDREAKLCTHLPEYLAEVVSKFGVDRIWNDVTVTSEVKL